MDFAVTSRGRVYTRLPPHERVLARVAHVGDCWIFQGALRNGYAAVSVWRDGRWTAGYGHIVMYESLVGPIPEGMQLDHVKMRGCTSTACVNPAHLEPVTPRENVVRGDRPKQMAAENRDPTRVRNGRRIR